MHCQHCDREFEAKKPLQKFCSSRCRNVAWQDIRKAKLQALIKALAKEVGLRPEDFA